MNQRKIAIVLIKHEEERFAHLRREIRKLVLPPMLDEYEIILAEGNISSIANQVAQKSDTLFRLFISDEVRSIENPALLADLFLAFNRTFHISIVGFLGGGLPLEGDIAGADFHLYGRHDRIGPAGSLIAEETQNTSRIQPVDSMDPAIFATCNTQLPWDEEIGDFFAVTAYVQEQAKRGKMGVIFKQTDPMVTFYGESVFRRTKDAEYDRQREIFCRKYPEETMPLVSVAIPTYNQPEFFREALESALTQDYPRLEIIVGDDSTDDRTEKLIRPYLEKYPMLQYTHHEKPLGDHGVRNLEYCVERSGGQYVNVLLHDDVFRPGKLRRMVNAYKEDIEGQLAVVTSARDIVNGEGQLLYKAANCGPFEDEVVPGRMVCRDMLMHIYNNVGELTTMLLKREDALHCGYYFGLHDKSLWDISTVLELCRRGRSVLFLSHPYSAAKRHGAQNTENDDVILDTRFMWFAMATISYLHDLYFDTLEEYKTTLKLYVNAFRYTRIGIPEDAGDDYRKKYLLYQEIVEAVEGNRWELFLHKMVEYMMNSEEPPESLPKVCCRDEATGLWRKR